MAFWRPGAQGPSLDREAEVEESFAVPNPFSRYGIQRQRRFLPVFQYRRDFLYMVEKYQFLIVVGETGSGKTTQLTQYLHEAGWTSCGRRVVCTQPRRVAAVSVASRVADEMGSALGQEVGYAVRFDSLVDEVRTRIAYMTDGHLLREMMHDPLLSVYSVVVLDEAHERNVYTDILMGLLKRVCRRRPELRVVVSSATLQAGAFRSFFETNRTGDPARDRAAVLAVEGRQHPVDVLFLERPVSNYLEACVTTVLSIHELEPAGDVLVFLPGADEIEAVVEMLVERGPAVRGRGPMVVFPMYSTLPARLQMRVFDRVPPGSRKVVCATTIAETSVTIDGIVYVVDSMFCKTPMYNARTGLESLVIQPVSQASATQRAGRAGRVQPGKCFRLCTEKDFGKLKPFNIPDIQRTPLHWVVLQLKALGVDNALRFDFPSPPTAEALARALELLYALSVLDDECKLTRPLGMSVAEMPLEPRLARMLLASFELKCTEEALTVAAMVSVQHVFVAARKRAAKQQVDQCMRFFAAREGDHLTMVNIFNAFLENGRSQDWCTANMLNHRALVRAAEIRRQLRGYLSLFQPPGTKPASCEEDHDALRRCLVTGFFSNAARLLPNGNYRTIKDGREVAVHPSSVVYRLGHVPEWVIYHDVMLTSQEFIRDLTEIHPAWLTELAPHFYEVAEQKVMGKSEAKRKIAHLTEDEPFYKRVSFR